MAKEATGKAAASTSKKNEKKQPAKKKPGLFSRFRDYLKGVRLELKRVVWPTREEVINSTIIVIATLTFFSIYIFGVDQLSTIAITTINNLLG